MPAAPLPLALLALAGALQAGSRGPVVPSRPPRRPPVRSSSFERSSSVRAVRGLYKAFNDRDAEKAGSFLTDDCIYEDLLLGPATVCRGKEAFIGALSMHPAFISDRLVAILPWASEQSRVPSLELVVDSVADGTGSVGVEWHVELGGWAIPLGRGLSHAIICPRTGKISRVVDIAEAPWRMIGLAVAPAANVFQRLARVASALNKDRQSAAIAVGTVWVLVSTLLVSSWLFSYGSPEASDIVTMPDDAPSVLRRFELRAIGVEGAAEGLLPGLEEHRATSTPTR
mmetsp:Transcript_28329/g.83190  ORF Transcript_28329/g.83190 Transcript_28329/m.83190 type:complete len:285 (-) Transcript_28329:268-1122(-)